MRTDNKKRRGLVTSDGVEIELTEPWSVEKLKKLQPEDTFVGRVAELRLCRAAWGLNREGTEFRNGAATPMHFRLEGEPGVGKNAIVYEMAITLNRPLYIVQGHEDLTPEDLAVALVPTNRREMPFVLRAGPVASAIYCGGLVFFDEINRVPQKALAQLASVLDARQAIFSAMANLWIERNPEVKSTFRFCCAMNPNAPDAGDLPDYVSERTLPAIRVSYLKLPEILEVITRSVAPPKPLIDAYEKWHHEREVSSQYVSSRIAIYIVRLARILMEQEKNIKPKEAIAQAVEFSGLMKPF
jgi:MoxR-like ATPase